MYWYDMFPILGWGYFGFGHFLHIFVTHVAHVILFKDFYFHFAPSRVNS
jgi:hypothetical protein